MNTKWRMPWLLPFLILGSCVVADAANKRICIIGTRAAVSLSQVSLNQKEFEPVVFEKRSTRDGLWIYSEDIDDDDLEIPGRSNLFKYSRSIGHQKAICNNEPAESTEDFASKFSKLINTVDLRKPLMPVFDSKNTNKDKVLDAVARFANKLMTAYEKSIFEKNQYENNRECMLEQDLVYIAHNIDSSHRHRSSSWFYGIYLLIIKASLSIIGNLLRAFIRFLFKRNNCSVSKSRLIHQSNCTQTDRRYYILRILIRKLNFAYFHTPRSYCQTLLGYCRNFFIRIENKFSNIKLKIIELYSSLYAWIENSCSDEDVRSICSILISNLIKIIHLLQNRCRSGLIKSVFKWLEYFLSKKVHRDEIEKYLSKLICNFLRRVQNDSERVKTLEVRQFKVPLHTITETFWGNIFYGSIKIWNNFNISCNNSHIQLIFCCRMKLYVDIFKNLGTELNYRISVNGYVSYLVSKKSTWGNLLRCCLH